MAAELTLMKEFGLRKDCYATLTLHRPSNVDDPEILGQILKALEKISRDMPIVFPIHPRTYKMIEDFGYGNFLSSGLPARGIWAVQPLGYLQFLHLNMNAKLVLTDSGGLQEETTVLGVPCITLRPNTERPITCAIGTNQVVGSRGEDIINAAKKVLNNPKVGTRVPDKWDGAAAERIVDVLMASDL